MTIYHSHGDEKERHERQQKKKLQKVHLSKRTYVGVCANTIKDIGRKGKKRNPLYRILLVLHFTVVIV